MLLVRRSMELVKRRQKLGGEFTGGNAEIQKGRNAMDADTSNWPPDERPDQIQPEIQAFVRKTRKASQLSKSLAQFHLPCARVAGA